MVFLSSAPTVITPCSKTKTPEEPYPFFQACVAYKNPLELFFPPSLPCLPQTFGHEYAKDEETHLLAQPADKQNRHKPLP